MDLWVAPFGPLVSASVKTGAFFKVGDLVWFKKAKRQELVYRENIELGARVKHLEDSLKLVEQKLQWWVEAKNVEVTNWRERGDRYAAFNTALEERFAKIQTCFADVLKNPEIIHALKDREKKK